MSISYSRKHYKNGYWTVGIDSESGKIVGKSKWHGSNSEASKTIIENKEKRESRARERLPQPTKLKEKSFVKRELEKEEYRRAEYKRIINPHGRYTLVLEITAKNHKGNIWTYYRSMYTDKPYITEAQKEALSQWLNDEPIEGSDIIIIKIDVILCYDGLSNEKISSYEAMNR